MIKVQNSIQNNPKYFWKFFKGKKSHNSIPNNVNYNKVIADDGQNMSNLFGKIFSNVYKKSLLNIPDMLLNHLSVLTT